MNYSLITPQDVRETLAARTKALRLQANWKQVTLAERAGVSQATLQRFENNGQTSVDNLLKIALALGRLDEFMALLKPPPASTLRELEQQAGAQPKQRGRQ